MLTAVGSVLPRGRCRRGGARRRADNDATAGAPWSTAAAAVAAADGNPSTGSRVGVDVPQAAPNSRPGAVRQTSRGVPRRRPLDRPNGLRRRPRASKCSCPTVSPRPCSSRVPTTRFSRSRLRHRTVCSSGPRSPVRSASVRTG